MTGPSLCFELIDGDREYVLAPGDELETDLGVLTVPSDAAPGDVVETHLGDAFRARRLRGPDCFHHFDRTGAPMTPKDAGLVLGYAGIGTGDRVLDAGTGTGALAAYLGLAGADIVTFERDAAFAEVAGENLRTAGLADRVDVVAADACDALAGHEADFDAVTLDTPDAPSLVERAPALLAPGGVAAAYSPFVEDARETAAAARDAGLDAETHETIERRMDFDDRGSRPTPAGVGHTGYLLIGRVTG